MKLFLNDIRIDLRPANDWDRQTDFDREFDSAAPLNATKLEGHILIHDGHPNHFDALMALMEVKRLKKLKSITYLCEDYDKVKAFIKSQFRIVKAGGGLVQKKGKILLIYRLGHWDLPKGKLEKDERSIEGAVREVEEECNIKVRPVEKLVSTWHSYVIDGRKTLKKTTWYLMDCVDDTLMKPQTEEGIDDLRWMSPAEYERALGQSYESIREVFRAWEAQKTGV